MGKEDFEVCDLRDEIHSIQQSLAKTRRSIQSYSSYVTLLETVWDNIEALLFFKDKENNIIRVNQYFCDVLGGEKNDFQGKNVLELMENKIQASKYAQNDLKVFLKGEPLLGRIEKLFDTNITLRTDKFPIKNEKGEVLGILGFSVILKKDAD